MHNEPFAVDFAKDICDSQDEIDFCAVLACELARQPFSVSIALGVADLCCGAKFPRFKPHLTVICRTLTLRAPLPFSIHSGRIKLLLTGGSTCIECFHWQPC